MFQTIIYKGLKPHYLLFFNINSALNDALCKLPYNEAHTYAGIHIQSDKNINRTMQNHNIQVSAKFYDAKCQLLKKLKQFVNDA